MATPNSTPPVAPTAAATPSFLCRAKTRSVDFLVPEFLRREYGRIVANTEESSQISAEYEQPGYFPRPPEWTVGIIGGLCAFTLLFSTFALMEYADGHTWFWNEEGFVWPWVGILWSLTVYNDETLNDSEAAYDGTSITACPMPGSTTPAGPPTPPKIIIPPTPLLPRGLRPVHLPPPLTHHSGILGESPMPTKFKHFSRHSNMGIVDEE
ncbi:hypothetical protein G6011_03549 [Alternaria panax]|uniref:Uncharacterized protein n=1 Tax=Alternaria panax TaxID=48097 RepID=A0AAD4IFF0_9PLEO|nr:hypothetical protein G6011_03549 [Alternaria panax]